MSFTDAANVSVSGLTAQRLRMDIISENIANVDTTRTEKGGPYKRKTVMFQEMNKDLGFSAYFNDAINKVTAGRGVRVSRVVEDTSEGPKVYEPGHPDADKEGYVMKPNVNIVVEMVNMISATRSYEANVTALNGTKGMVAKTMEIGRQ